MPPPKDAKQVLNEFAANTSMHGVPRIIKAGSVPTRVLWSSICLAAFGMFLWQSTILLQRYCSYPKKVNVEIIQQPVQFPAVSVCNSDPLDILVADWLSGYIMEVNKTINNTQLEADLTEITDQYGEFYSKASLFVYIYAKMRPNSRLNEDHIILEILSRFGMMANMGVRLSSLAGIKAKDFIVSCRFMDDTCDVATAFEQIFDPYFFNCYTFKPEAILPKRAAHLHGVEYGLSLLMFTGSSGQMVLGPEYENLMVPGMQESDVALASGKGARVVVHSPHTRPYPRAEGFAVPPGFSVEIGVKAHENVRIQHPYGNCSDKASNNSRYHDTLMQCQNECIQKRIMKVCGCIDNQIPEPEDTEGLSNCFQLPELPEICYMEPGQDCMNIIQKWINKVDCHKAVYENMTIRDPQAMESCQCYPPCNEIIYDTHFSLSKLPEDTDEHSAFYSVIKQFYNVEFSPIKRKHLQETYGPNEYDDKMKSQISRLNVHIADSNIIKTTEAPDYEAVQLMSDIGGQLALWIGISVITLFEVLQVSYSTAHFLRDTNTRSHTHTQTQRKREKERERELQRNNKILL